MCFNGAKRSLFMKMNATTGEKALENRSQLQLLLVWFHVLKYAPYLELKVISQSHFSKPRTIICMNGDKKGYNKVVYFCNGNWRKIDVETETSTDHIIPVQTRAHTHTQNCNATQKWKQMIGYLGHERNERTSVKQNMTRSWQQHVYRGILLI